MVQGMNKLFLFTEPLGLEQCIGVRVAPHEAAIKLCSRLTIALRENAAAEVCARVPVEYALFVKAGVGICGEYLSPFI